MEAGCDIESKDNSQRTPVHWAVLDSGMVLITMISFHILCTSGSIRCLQSLVMLGANFNEIDGEGLNGIYSYV